MKKSWIYIFFVILTMYLGLQLYNISFPGVITERATPYTAYKRLTMSGLVMRNEDILYNQNSGVVGHLVYDGNHVKTGTKVATVYSSIEDVDTQMAIRELESDIEKLEIAQSPNGLAIRDANAIDNKITTLLSNVVYDINRQDVTAVSAYKDEIELMLNVKSLLNNTKQNFDQEIAELKAKKVVLSSKVSNKISDVFTPVPGYFCTRIDGYEEQFKPKMLSSINVADVELMLEMDSTLLEENPPHVVGKMITDYDWYYAGIVDSEAMKQISVGQQVTLTFPFSVEQETTGEVYNISEPSDGRCVVVIKSNVMTDEMKYLRKERCDVILDTYEGIRVPKEARRVLDGKVGVYVLKGSVCTFKEINILYEDENCVVAEKLDPVINQNCLQVTDEIIVDGKDLYDKKIVK